MNEKVTEIFAQVAGEPDPGKRQQLLNELCQSNDELRLRVEKLIAAHVEPDSFFDDPLHANHDRGLGETAAGGSGFVRPGSVIGPYKLLQEIGEGGMGLVFMAEQFEPVKRRVALKVIKPGMDSRQVIARFEAERQALAMMDHPNIAKVLDAGTTDQGHPYFVMELVNGFPVTEYCDQETLTTQQRLQLFVDICRAIQHAHQKGVIHRDLKPNNILVAEYDGKPMPKVIDFGVAKATGLQLTEKTLFTEFGQVIGTIEYMSPEQARRNQLDIDTRSDIYSLGIVLYKLLTGETPFGPERFKQAAWEEMVKIIREEEPPLPSVKLGSSQSLNQIALRRKVQPTRLTALVRGDLDWIVLKTLEKDRNRRYPSAGELADDVERHLRQLPVNAAPRSTLVRASKFARRNRKLLANVMVAIFAVAFFGYLGATGASDLKQRNDRLAAATLAAEQAIASAQLAPIGDDTSWETASVHCQRVEESLNSGIVSRDLKQEALNVLADFRQKQNERELASQIEDVVIRGASDPSLASWESMEREIRDFFRRHGFDLDKSDPAEIGKKIRADASSVLWADLLELWIGTKAQLAGLGGPKLTAATMQPWADAIYVADVDPIRTGIRRFIYAPPRNRESLDKLVAGVELESLPPRTLSWLATSYGMVAAHDETDRIFRIALLQYPRDVMLAHDYGYALYHQQRFQESARMYHRCLALRDDVPGLWKSLALTLTKLEEHDAANRALEIADSLKQPRN